MSTWLRSIRFWKFFAEYYPATCVFLISCHTTLSTESYTKVQEGEYRLYFNGHNLECFAGVRPPCG